MTSTMFAPSPVHRQLDDATLDGFRARIAVIARRIGRAPIALVDMDGVVYEWGAMFNEVLLRIDPDFPIVDDNERIDYDHLAGPGADPRTIRWAMEHPRLYTHGEMTPGADVALAIMAWVGLDVSACTTPAWRNPHGYSGKVQFALDKFGDGIGDNLILVADKTLVFGDIIIDDKPAITGRMSIDGRSPSWDHIVYARSYNHLPAGDTRSRIESWAGLAWLETIVAVLERKFPA